MNSKPNWQTLLRRWISGEADRSDERSLEVLAKDDPFLAEALEGYRAVPEADHERSVTRLKASLRSKYEKKRKGAIFYIQRIAAVGVLLLGAWFVFRSFDARDEARMVQTDASIERDASPSVIGNSSPDTAVLDFASKSKIELESAPQKNANQRPQIVFDRIAAKQSSPTPPPVTIIPPPDKEEHIAEVFEELKNVPKVQSEEPTKKIETVADGIAIAKEGNNAATMPPPAPAENKTFADLDGEQVAVTPMISHTIEGIVTDMSGKPLIGVSILIENTEKGIVSDLDGKFTLQSPVENPALVVSYTGFTTQVIQTQGERFLNVQLDESSGSLSEIVVTKRFGRSKAKAKRSLQIEPKGGFKKFEKYVIKNLHKPQAAIDAGKKGQVTVRFKLDASGKPIDFEILQPLGFGCDEEAIRLLRDGPKWNGPANTFSSYSFEF